MEVQKGHQLPLYTTSDFHIPTSTLPPTNVFSFRELNHPNLLSLLSAVTKPHSLVLLMNYVEGQTLDKVILLEFRFVVLLNAILS